MNIYIASDLHYLSRKLYDGGAAYESFCNNSGVSQIRYSADISDAFLSEVKVNKPDALILSGDLTTNGEKQSHLDLAEELGKLVDMGIKVYVVPGNHDINNAFARSFKDDKQVKTDYVTPEDFKSIYSKCGYRDAVLKDKSTLSYLAAPSDDLWLLMIDSCKYGDNIKYGGSESGGEIRSDTLAWIEECKKLADSKRAKVITVMHHNIMTHNPLFRYEYTLDDNLVALDAFQKMRLNMVFSGHIHVQDARAYTNDNFSLTEVVSSALVGYPHQYGRIVYTKSDGAVEYSTQKVDVAKWAKETAKTKEDLLNFNEYALSYFLRPERTIQRMKGYGDFTEEQAQKMAEVYQIMNSHYYSGTLYEIKDEIVKTEGYKLLLSLDNFMGTYINCMIDMYSLNSPKLRVILP